MTADGDGRLERPALSANDMATLIRAPDLDVVRLSFGWGCAVSIQDEDDQEIVARRFYASSSRGAVAMFTALLRGVH